MVQVQKWPSFKLFFFRQYRPGKCLLPSSRTKKTPFYPIKKRSLKSRKIDIFPKGLTHGFGPKITISQTFFSARQARKMSFIIFQNEKTPFYTIKKRSLKSRKIKIFPNELTDGFGPKMAIFQNFFFLARQARKMSFTTFLNEKTPFYVIKTRSLKSRKIDIFPKGLTHGFGPKMTIFSTFIFRQHIPGKCLLQ